MSLLRVVQRGATSRSAAFSASNIARKQSTSAPQAGVEVAQKQASEITTTVPPKEAVAADVISGAPGAFLLLYGHRFPALIGMCRRAPSPHRAYLQADAQHDAKRRRKGRELAHRLRHPARRWALGKPSDGMGQLVRNHHSYLLLKISFADRT